MNFKNIFSLACGFSIFKGGQRHAGGANSQRGLLLAFAFGPSFFCIGGMNNKIEVITPQTMAHYEKMRRGIVDRVYNDTRLFQEYGLTPRAAAFAREYALTGNAQSSSRVAGYAENTTRKNTARIIAKTAKAIKAIKSEISEYGADFRAGLSEYLANGLIEIFENRLQFPGAAIYAARELRRIYLEGHEIEDRGHLEENTTGVNEAQLKEIENECRKMGIYQ